MTKKIKKLLIFLIAFLSISFLYAQEESENAPEVTETRYVKKHEWYIYKSNTKNIYKGPFDTLDEVLIAWRNDSKLKPKGKYFIGRNGIKFTNNPLIFYRADYARIDGAETEKKEETPAVSAKNTETKETFSEELEYESLFSPVSESQTPVLETGGQSEPILAENETEETPYVRKNEWYIYKTNAKNIYKGPFDTLEEVLLAWREDKKIKPRGKYYIGRNGVNFTNNPEVYYVSEYAKIDGKKKEDPILSNVEPENKKPSLTENRNELIQRNAELLNTENKSTEDTIVNQVTFDQKADEVSVLRPQPTPHQRTYLSDFFPLEVDELPDEKEEIDKDLILTMNDVDFLGRTQLMNAVRQGNDWQTRTLLKAKCDIHIRDNDGWTALMYAVRYQSNLEILNLLLEAGANIREENNYGLSSLVIAACYNNNPEILRRMLSYYEPSEKDVQKAFVMLLSTQQTSEFTLVAKAKVFIETGLPINSYYDGKTPLMYACSFSSSTKVLKLLLDSGATLSVRSSEGKNAFEYARENKALAHDDIYWSLNKKK